MLRSLFVIAACLLAMSTGVAGERPSMIDFERNYVRAHGGLVFSDSIRSMRIRGTTSQGENTAEFVLLKRRPDMLRVTLTMAGQDNVVGYDGEIAWALSSRGIARELVDAERLFLVHQARFVSPLMNIRGSGVAYEVLDSAEVDGTHMHVIQLTYPSGIVETVYLDAETWLEARIETKVHPTANPFLSIYTDWQTFDGLPMATKVENRQGDRVISTTEIVSVELNRGLNSTLFRSPLKGL